MKRLSPDRRYRRLTRCRSATGSKLPAGSARWRALAGRTEADTDQLLIQLLQVQLRKRNRDFSQERSEFMVGLMGSGVNIQCSAEIDPLKLLQLRGQGYDIQENRHNSLPKNESEGPLFLHGLSARARCA